MKRFVVFLICAVMFPFVVHAGIFFSDTDIQSDGPALGFNATSGYDINFGNGDLFVSKSNGFIGIGTTVPSYPLHVVGTALFSTSTGAGSPTTGGQAATKGYVDSILGGGVGTGTANQTLRNNGTGWVASPLLINNGSSIGVGITPTLKFDVYNAAPSGNIIGYFQSGSSSGLLNLNSLDASWNFGSTGSGLQFYNNNTSQYRMTVTNAGNVGIGTATPSAMLDVQGTGSFSSLSVGNPTSAAHAATKSYADSLFSSVWTLGASNAIYAGNSGNIGIGTNTPQTKLDVSGSVRATGIQIGTSTTSGYALTTDANGVGTWQALPGNSTSKPGGSSFTLHSSIGVPKSFTFETYTSSVGSYFTCPTGYSLWYDANAYWSSTENGNTSYFGACYQTSLTDDVFIWKAYSPPTSVACPVGYTKWSNNSYPGYGIYSSHTAYNGACYKGSPSSFTWESYTGNGNPTTFMACPSGYTAWYHANAQWYSSTAGYYNYTGSCYNASATTDAFKWKSTSPASVTCPAGYTAWYSSNLAYGPGSVSYYTGVCYKGSPVSFPWEIYTSYAPTTVTCPSGYTNWYDTTYAKYYTYDGSYQSYNGYCVNTSLPAGDAFSYFSTSGSDSISCPSGYTKWQGNASYYAYRGSGNAAYSSACYKVPSASCQACPSGWTEGSCNTVSTLYGDYGEKVCYKQGGPIQSLVVSKKGLDQTLSCPAGFSSAGATANVVGNTERVCYLACSSFSSPLTPTSLSGSAAGLTINLSWSTPAATDCTATDSYNIYRSLTSGSGYTLYASGVAATSFADATTTPSTTYYYKVTGVNIAGESGYSNEVSVSTPNILYTFSNHTFTNCSQTGRTGPTVTACQSAYSTTWDENSSFYNATSGIQLWTVPETGIYTIRADGAQGGTMSYQGGKGALIQGDVFLKLGEVISILVGQQGGAANNGIQYNGGNGGGGGTFVVDSNNQPIIVAGGGGGAPGTNGGGSASGGQTTINGTAGQTSGGGTAGTAGSGGGRANYSGGGAGWLTNGITNIDGGGSSSWYDYGGTRFLEGGFGGDNGSSVWSGWGGNIGGFGGGGAGGLTAGGGGGYSGGGAGGSWGSTYGGGGGGSYNTGATQTNTANSRSGSGQVVVTKCSTAASQIPGAPANPAIVSGTGQITVTWNRGFTCAGAPTSFNIYRSLTSGSGFTLYTTTSSTSYIDTGVSNGTIYYYKISAVNSFGESAQSAEISGTTAMAPTNLSLSQTNGSQTFTVSWTAGAGNGGAGGCKLQFYTGSTWTDITSASSVNCDATATNANYTLNADGWKANWGGTQIRIVRKSDLALEGTFSQTLVCTAQTYSLSSTPTIDEDCNGAWNNTGGQSVSGCASTEKCMRGRWYDDNVCTTLQGTEYQCIDATTCADYASQGCIPNGAYPWSGGAGGRAYCYAYTSTYCSSYQTWYY